MATMLGYIATDAKVDFDALLAGVNRANYTASLPEIGKRLVSLTRGKLAADADLAPIIAKAARGGGGEGPDHLALKNYVCANPHLVGLKIGDPAGESEYGLPSGDCVDVVFAQKRRIHAVEVKPAGSGSDDIARGLFQCVKYRAVLLARAAYEHDNRSITVCLALGGALPSKLVPLRNSLGVAVFESIVPVPPL
jgi:hypothetical protein